jgi:hypothetical protein
MKLLYIEMEMGVNKQKAGKLLPRPFESYTEF